MTLVEFLTEFKIWGPLGIWAALTTWGCVHLYRAIRGDSKAHAAALKTQQDEHHRQMTELTGRFVDLHAQAATENRELTQQVRALLEVVSKKRGR